MITRNFVLSLTVMSLFGAFPVLADPDRWIETDVWSGTGMKTTEAFLVGGQKWRVVARRQGSEPRKVQVVQEDGTPFAEVQVLKKGVPALKTLKGPGMYRVSVRQADGPWSVKILQKMTVIEEWNYRQKIKKKLPPLNILSVFSGQDSLERFTFTVPEGKSWRLVCEGEAMEDGGLTLRVTQLGTTSQDIFFYETTGTVDCDQWFTASGEFELTVDAQKLAWKAEIQSE